MYPMSMQDLQVNQTPLQSSLPVLHAYHREQEILQKVSLNAGYWAGQLHLICILHVSCLAGMLLSHKLCMLQCKMYQSRHCLVSCL